MNRRVRAFLVCIDVMIAARAETDTALRAAGLQQRLETTLHKYGLDQQGTFVLADEERIALEILNRIASGQHAAATIEGERIPARTVVDSLEYLTGTRITGAAQRRTIIDLFRQREEKRTKLAASVCEIAGDPTYKDEEFIAAAEAVGAAAVSALRTFELKSLVPASTLAALQEREAEFGRLMVEEPRRDAWDAFHRETVDVQRPNTAVGAAKHSLGPLTGPSTASCGSVSLRSRREMPAPGHTAWGKSGMARDRLAVRQ